MKNLYLLYIFRQAAALAAASHGDKEEQNLETRIFENVFLQTTGTSPGDQVMPGNDFQTLAWELNGTLVLSCLLPEITLYF